MKLGMKPFFGGNESE
jgi:calcium/calmodulin-dependent protein kinase I